MSLLTIEADGSGPNFNQTEEYESWDRRSSHILEVVVRNESYETCDRCTPEKTSCDRRSARNSQVVTVQADDNNDQGRTPACSSNFHSPPNICKVPPHAPHEPCVDSNPHINEHEKLNASTSESGSDNPTRMQPGVEHHQETSAVLGTHEGSGPPHSCSFIGPEGERIDDGRGEREALRIEMGESCAANAHIRLPVPKPEPNSSHAHNHSSHEFACAQNNNRRGGDGEDDSSLHEWEAEPRQPGLQRVNAGPIPTYITIPPKIKCTWNKKCLLRTMTSPGTWWRLIFYLAHASILFPLYYVTAFPSYSQSQITTPCNFKLWGRIEETACGLGGSSCDYGMWKDEVWRARRCAPGCDQEEHYTNDYNKNKGEDEKEDEKEEARSYVWGTHVYSANSPFCAAAIHSGHLSAHKGGLVYFQILRHGKTSHAGSWSHGIKSHSLGEFPKALKFKKASAAGSDEKDGDAPVDYSTPYFIMMCILCGIYTIGPISSSPRNPPAWYTPPGGAEYYSFILANGYIFLALVVSVRGKEQHGMKNVVYASGEGMVIGAFAMAVYHLYARSIIPDKPDENNDSNNHNGTIKKPDETTTSTATCNDGPKRNVNMNSLNNHKPTTATTLYIYPRLSFLSFYILSLFLEDLAEQLPDLSLSGGNTFEHLLVDHRAILTLCLIGILGILPLVGFTIYDYALRPGGWKHFSYVACSRSGILVAIIIIGLCVPNYTYHIHHNFFGLLIASCAKYPTIAHNAVLGLGVGLYVEGVARWKWKPNWDYAVDEENLDPVVRFRTPSPYVWLDSSTSAIIMMKKLRNHTLDNYGVVVTVNSVIRFQGARSDMPFRMTSHLSPGTINYVSLKWDVPNSWRSITLEFRMPKTDEVSAIYMSGYIYHPHEGGANDEQDANDESSLANDIEEHSETKTKSPQLRKVGHVREDDIVDEDIEEEQGAWSWFTSLFN